MAGCNGNVGFGILWGILLVLLVWPLALLVSWVYIFVGMLSGCLPLMDKVMLILEKALLLPNRVAQKVVTGGRCCVKT